MLRYLRDWGISLAIAAMVFLGITMLRPGPDLPEMAPEFELVNIDGGRVTLSELRGKTVVLNFWATWCGPCRQEIPAFSKFADANPDIVVLGVATDGTLGGLQAARNQLGITYPVLMGEPATSKAYDVRTIPTTVVVDPDGRVRTAHVGVMMGWQLALATR